MTDKQKLVALKQKIENRISEINALRFDLLPDRDFTRLISEREALIKIQDLIK
jgi:hypothetical protein